MIVFGFILFAVYIVFRVIYLTVPVWAVRRHPIVQNAQDTRTFAVLVPAYNEEKAVLGCVQSLTKLSYSRCKFSVYIINDGSTDATFEVLDAFLYLLPTGVQEDERLLYNRVTGFYVSVLYPNFYVINKEKGGKADALNAGIACSSEEIAVTLDADCMLREDALGVMDSAFADESLVAAGGTVHIVQGVEAGSKPRLRFRFGTVIRFQMMQYLAAFYLHKAAQSRCNALIVISGAYGAFRRSALLAVGGYRNSVGEDMDITLKMHLYNKRNKGRTKMKYIPESVCYTECPETFTDLTKQRLRWQKAFVDCALTYGMKMFVRFSPGVSLFFVLDCLLLGTVSSALFAAVLTQLILSGRASAPFLVMAGIDFLFGTLEKFVSLHEAKRYGYRFRKEDLPLAVLFIPMAPVLYALLSVLYVCMGTLLYFVNRNTWYKAQRAGRQLAEQTSDARAG